MLSNLSVNGMMVGKLLVAGDKKWPVSPVTQGWRWCCWGKPSADYAATLEALSDVECIGHDRGNKLAPLLAFLQPTNKGIQTYNSCLYWMTAGLPERLTEWLPDWLSHLTCNKVTGGSVTIVFHATITVTLTGWAEFRMNCRVTEPPPFTIMSNLQERSARSLSQWWHEL